MTVYVDALMSSAPYRRPSNNPWPYPTFCHLWADSFDELEAFARRLGLKRAWLQHRETEPRYHYDLTEAKRNHALGLGAVER